MQQDIAVHELLQRPPGRHRAADDTLRRAAAAAQKEFLALPFSTLSFGQVADLLAERAAASPFCYLATPNSQHATHFNRGNFQFIDGLAGAALLTCDSRILQALARRLFHISLPLVTGSDLTRHLFEAVILPDDPITLIGGDDTMAALLRAQYGLTRLHQYVPPFGFSRDVREMERCAAFVRAHPARFVFIACGAPQSEFLAAFITRQKGISGIGLCVGAAMQFVTGQRRRAPLALQRVGLEWLHRLVMEPGRLLPRLWRGQLPVLRLAAAAWLAARTAERREIGRSLP